MRFFALGLLSSLTLVLSACGDDGKEPTTSVTATNTTPSGPTSDPGTGSNGTTTDDQTGTTSDDSTTDISPTSTTEPATSTTEPGTTTSEPGTTTGEPGTSTTDEPGTTTGGGLEPGSDYGPCSNNQMNPVACDSMFCIDPVSTGNEVKGSFCSPKCTGPGKLCSKPDGASAQLQPACLFDTNNDMSGDICALVCPIGMDICPTGMTCEDIGIPEQMGVTPGICTHPI